MNETRAKGLALATGGEAWQSGGDLWIVAVRRLDGSLVVFSGDAVCEYPDNDAFEAGKATAIIVLA